jgi:hypothetical protein
MSPRLRSLAQRLRLLSLDACLRFLDRKRSKAMPMKTPANRMQISGRICCACSLSWNGMPESYLRDADHYSAMTYISNP